MGTPQMRAKISIPSITVNGVILPVLNEPVGNLGTEYVCTLYQKLSSLQITTLGKLEK